jgi:protein-S-isoprenylcysteine O-methyltransferase Ste14
LADHPRVITFPPLILLAAYLAGRFLHDIWPLPFFTFAGSWTLGWVIVAVALILPLWSFLTFHRANTAVNPYRPTTSIVTTGPFRFSRNPMYGALLVIQAAFSLNMHNLWQLIMVLPMWAILRYGVIAPEERYLEEKFGEEYRQYKARVRRWV